MNPLQPAKSSLQATVLPLHPRYTARRVSRAAVPHVLMRATPAAGVHAYHTSFTNVMPLPSSQVGSSAAFELLARRVSKA